MSSLNAKNTTSLMYLSGGVLALLLVTYFTVNAKSLNPEVGAHRKTSMVGVLRKDSMHKRICNLVAKAEYVLEDKTDSSKCMPVVANPSQADEHVGSEVEVSGDSASGQYFAVGFRRMHKDSSPDPDMTPRSSMMPRGSFNPRPTGSGMPFNLPKGSGNPTKTNPPDYIRY